jgi:hypothetical protein
METHFHILGKIVDIIKLRGFNGFTDIELELMSSKSLSGKSKQDLIKKLKDTEFLQNTTLSQADRINIFLDRVRLLFIYAKTMKVDANEIYDHFDTICSVCNVANKQALRETTQLFPVKVCCNIGQDSSKYSGEQSSRNHLRIGGHGKVLSTSESYEISNYQGQHVEIL